MPAGIQSVRRWLGVDRAIFYNLAGRVWSMGAGPVTALLVGTCLSEDEQGFFYTFLSILGLQVFLELGFGQCLVQFASHEFARLEFRADGRLQGHPEALGRLASLGRIALRWYAAMALVFLGLVGAAGHAFLGTQGSQAVAWVAPWWCLCALAAAGLVLQPLWFLLEGCNQVAFVNGYRTFAQVVMAGAMWLTLLQGGALFASPAAALGSLVLSAACLLGFWRGLIRQLLEPSTRQGLALLREIWPFQSRLAVSFASGYLIFNLFTPAMHYFQGPAVAGQMGMTWQLVGALNLAASAWLSTKAPRFGMLVSQQDRGALDRLSRQATLQAVAIASVGGVGLLGALAWLKAWHPLGARFLDLPCTGLLVIATVVNQVIAGRAFYLRAHKQDPLMWLALLQGLLIAAGVLILGRTLGPLGACLVYAGVCTLILPLSGLVYRTHRAAALRTDPAPKP